MATNFDFSPGADLTATEQDLSRASEKLAGEEILKVIVAICGIGLGVLFLLGAADVLFGAEFF